MRPRRRRPSPPPPVGELPARDAFLLNPYADFRYTRCPRCGHRTWRRKVPLLLAVAGYGPLSTSLIAGYEQQNGESLARASVKHQRLDLNVSDIRVRIHFLACRSKSLPL